MQKARGSKGAGRVIPNKLYFRIGEVSDIVSVKPYVLRYWESEFPDIKPAKSKSGQRLYKRRDVEALLQIKELLYDERFTIDGARKRLKDIARGEFKEPTPSTEMQDSPKQLEVFDVSEALPVSKETVTDRKSEAQRDASKVLIKIRKDLESLLEVVQSE